LVLAPFGWRAKEMVVPAVQLGVVMPRLDPGTDVFEAAGTPRSEVMRHDELAT
jgi:hypothetical protein